MAKVYYSKGYRERQQEKCMYWSGTGFHVLSIQGHIGTTSSKLQWHLWHVSVQENLLKYQGLRLLWNETQYSNIETRHITHLVKQSWEVLMNWYNMPQCSGHINNVINQRHEEHSEGHIPQARSKANYDFRLPWRHEKTKQLDFCVNSSSKLCLIHSCILSECLAWNNTRYDLSSELKINIYFITCRVQPHRLWHFNMSKSELKFHTPLSCSSLYQ